MPKRQPLGRIKAKKKVQKRELAEEPTIIDESPAKPEIDINLMVQVTVPPASQLVEAYPHLSQVKRVNDKMVKVLPAW